jgi:hypothetical protein
MPQMELPGLLNAILPTLPDDLLENVCKTLKANGHLVPVDVNANYRWSITELHRPVKEEEGEDDLLGSTLPQIFEYVIDAVKQHEQFFESSVTLFVDDRKKPTSDRIADFRPDGYFMLNERLWQDGEKISPLLKEHQEMKKHDYMRIGGSLEFKKGSSQHDRQDVCGMYIM